MYGLSDDEVTALREGSYENFVPSEVSLLRMADAMADTPSNISDALYAELNTHFTADQLLELSANAALENYRARLSVRCGQRWVVSEGSQIQAALSLARGGAWLDIRTSAP